MNKHVDEIKKRYPPGTRIELISMNDIQAVPAGTMGTVDHVDDVGTLHMNWDNGRTLGLVPSEDQFRVIPEQEQMHTEKFYFPLSAFIYEDKPGDIGGTKTERELSHQEIAVAERQITDILKREELSDEAERRLMRWYGAGECIDIGDKVYSVRPSVELIDGTLWGVMSCEVKEELSAEETDHFKEWLTRQLSGGLGSEFDDRGISSEYGEMFIRFWSPENWELLSGDEMTGRQTQMGGQSM